MRKVFICFFVNSLESFHPSIHIYWLSYLMQHTQYIGSTSPTLYIFLCLKYILAVTVISDLTELQYLYCIALGFLQIMDKKTDKPLGELTYALKNLLSAPDMEVDRFFPLKNAEASSEISVRFALRVSAWGIVFFSFL